MLRSKVPFAALASFCLLAPASVLEAAAPPTLGPATEARVAFVASGPAGLKIEGVTPDLRVTTTDASLILTVPLTNLTTGIALRDRHMKERYLEIGKYPETTLTLVRSQLKLPGKGETVQGDVSATLNLHGQARTVTVHYEAHADGMTVAAQGRLHLLMTDFGITVPSYLGVTVKPDVDVTAAFHVPGSGS